METAQHPEPQRMEQYSVPIGGEAYVVITMPTKMTQEQYGRLKGYIDLFEQSHCELPLKTKNNDEGTQSSPPKK